MYILGLLCVWICSICTSSICRNRYIYVYVSTLCICSCVYLFINIYLPRIFLQFWLAKIMQTIFKYLCTPHIFFEFWLGKITFINFVSIFGNLYKQLLAFIFINWIYFREFFWILEFPISHIQITSSFRSYYPSNFALISLYLLQ